MTDDRNDWTATDWPRELGTERLRVIHTALAAQEAPLPGVLAREAMDELRRRENWWNGASRPEARPWWPLTDLEREAAPRGGGA